MEEVTAQQGASEAQPVAGSTLSFPPMTNQWSGQRVRFSSAFHVEQALSGIGIDALGCEVEKVKTYVFSVPKAVILFRLQERHAKEQNYEENKFFCYHRPQISNW